MLTREKLRRLRAEPLGSARNKVRLARELAGLTQVQVAEKAHYTQAFISSLERGEYADVTVTTAQALAELFGCAIEDIFPAREAVA
jgi:DNA-binding XRE family transcriptional regulator